MGSDLTVPAASAVILLEPATRASLASNQATYLVQSDTPSDWLTFLHDGPATWLVRFLDQSGRTFGTLTIEPSSELLTVDVVDGIDGGQPFLLTADRISGTSEGDRLTVISDDVAPAATESLDSVSGVSSGLITMLPDEFYEQILSSEGMHSPAPLAHRTGASADLLVQGENTGSATDFSLPSMPERIGGWSPIAPAESVAEEQGGDQAETGETDARGAMADLGNGESVASALATVDLARGVIDAPGGISAPATIAAAGPADELPTDATATPYTSGPDAPAYRRAEIMARGGAAEEEGTPRTGIALSLSATLVLPNLAVLTWSGRRRRSRRQLRDIECGKLTDRLED
jgi:hypothetical protein